MSVYTETKNNILRFAEGTVFSTSDFKVAPTEQNLLYKALSNSCKQGSLIRLSQSLYYKPEMTNLGPLPPSSNAIVKQLLKTHKKNIAYITGPSIYPRLGLSTQWTPEIFIATDLSKKAPMRIGALKVSFCPSSFKGKHADIYLLQWLDAIKNIKTISGTTPNLSALRLEQLLAEMRPPQLKKIVTYAASYPASTRALVGLLLEKTKNFSSAKRMYESLPHTSSYHIPLQPSVFPALSKWT